MDKTCEFCTALRPIVYCTADAAHLCLSCDAKIHSANALSNRHSRTLVCELCRNRQAYIRCSNHQMFMCRGCDRSQHEISSQHQKRVVSSYVGCPSAKDFAALWGFDLSESIDSTLHDQFVSASSVTVDTGGVNLDIPTQSCLKIGGSSLTSEVDSLTSFFSSQHTKAFYKGKQQENTCFILQQILDLKRLQLSDGGNNWSLIRCPEKSDISFSQYDPTWKLENYIDQNLQHSLGLRSDLQQMDSTHQDLNVEPFSSPFSQLDHLTSSATVGNPLQEEAFWQCKSPVQSGQLWSQNMQDLGVCEELGYLDDLSMPDVDLTFRNFEELFGGEQDPSGPQLDDKDMTCSSVEKDMSLDGSDNSYARAMESVHEDKDIGPPYEARYIPRSGDSSHPIRPSYSTLSFSLSRLSAESSGTDHMDSGLSPIVFRQEPEVKENVRTKYKEKKVRRYENQIQYASRKTRADLGGRGKGRFVKAEGYESDAIDVTRSY